MIKDESNKKCIAFCHILNNIGIIMKGMLVRTNPVCDADIAVFAVM